MDFGSVEIKFYGTAAQVRGEMLELLGGSFPAVEKLVAAAQASMATASEVLANSMPKTNPVSEPSLTDEPELPFTPSNDNEKPATSRRGRKRSVGVETASPARPTGVQDPEPVSQATVESNGASVPEAQTPASEGASGVEAGTTDGSASPASPEITFDTMRSALLALATLQNVSHKGTVHPSGMDAATAIISDLGYLKVKDIKPEHFAAIHAAATAAVPQAA